MSSKPNPTDAAIPKSRRCKTSAANRLSPTQAWRRAAVLQTPVYTTACTRCSASAHVHALRCCAVLSQTNSRFRSRPSVPRPGRLHIRLDCSWREGRVARCGLVYVSKHVLGALQRRVRDEVAATIQYRVLLAVTCRHFKCSGECFLDCFLLALLRSVLCSLQTYVTISSSAVTSIFVARSLATTTTSSRLGDHIKQASTTSRHLRSPRTARASVPLIPHSPAPTPECHVKSSQVRTQCSVSAPYVTCDTPDPGYSHCVLGAPSLYLEDPAGSAHSGGEWA